MFNEIRETFQRDKKKNYNLDSSVYNFIEQMIASHFTFGRCCQEDLDALKRVCTILL